MRLIDADALLMNMNLAIAILEGTMKNLGLQDDAECQMELKAYRNIRDGIKDEPTAEPSAQPEQRKGEWIDEGFYADGHGAHAFRCSECGGHIIEYDTDPFCRWCGADMRGGTHEQA